MVEVSKAIGAVGKNQTNTFDNYNFRGIDDVLNSLHKPLADAGIFVLPKVLSRDEVMGKTKAGGTSVRVILDVEYDFYAEDGSSVSARVACEAADRSDKATNKALSAGLKYMFIQAFCIPVKLEEADHQSPELPIKEKIGMPPDINVDEELPFDTDPKEIRKHKGILAKEAAEKGWDMDDLAVLKTKLFKNKDELNIQEISFMRQYVQDNSVETIRSN